jgi:hypothetical protein
MNIVIAVKIMLIKSSMLLLLLLLVVLKDNTPRLKIKTLLIEGVLGKKV